MSRAPDELMIWLLKASSQAPSQCLHSLIHHRGKVGWPSVGFPAIPPKLLQFSPPIRRAAGFPEAKKSFCPGIVARAGPPGPGAGRPANQPDALNAVESR